MMQLTERTDSQLAQDVQKLLVFMQQSDDERHQSYPVPDKDENDQKINAWQVTHYQLGQALAISSPWDSVRARNCLHGIICVDETSD